MYKIEKQIIGYAYPRNGNARNPTPKIQWIVRDANGKVIDHGRRKGESCRYYGIPLRS